MNNKDNLISTMMVNNLRKLLLSNGAIVFVEQRAVPSSVDIKANKAYRIAGLAFWSTTHCRQLISLHRFENSQIAESGNTTAELY